MKKKRLEELDASLRKLRRHHRANNTTATSGEIHEILRRKDGKESTLAMLKQFHFQQIHDEVKARRNRQKKQVEDALARAQAKAKDAKDAKVTASSDTAPRDLPAAQNSTLSSGIEVEEIGLQLVDSDSPTSTPRGPTTPS